MFGLDPTILMVIAFAGLSAGGIAYAILFDSINQENTSRKRLQNVQRAETGSVHSASRDKTTDASKRRKAVQETLKDLEDRQRARERNTTKPPLKVQIKQAGLDISQQQFFIASGVAGIAITALAFFIFPWFVLPGILLAATFGLPRWIILVIRKRRVKAFLDEFPNALDIIIRAIKSGLPLNDGIRLIASESRDPVKTEFQRIVEAQQVGLSVPEAAMRMTETMPCTEAGFFGIVLQIQAQAGGNLSEALGNLSRVLRDRKKMKAKVAALSMEAKASAYIIGSLPFAVGLMVYLTSPTYITPLFTTTTGNLILGITGFWMSCGIFVMRQMMNFEV